jgi:hypothetical protein
MFIPLSYQHHMCEIEMSLILAHISKIEIRILVKCVKWFGLMNQGGKTNQTIFEEVMWTSTIFKGSKVDIVLIIVTLHATRYIIFFARVCLVHFVLR